LYIRDWRLNLIGAEKLLIQPSTLRLGSGQAKLRTNEERVKIENQELPFIVRRSKILFSSLRA